MLVIRSSLRFMSDKLQFVVCCETRFHRNIDKLKEPLIKSVIGFSLHSRHEVSTTAR
jgi:hypothetical protein